MKQNDIMAAIEYLTPIMGNASLDNYKKHLNTAISALEKTTIKKDRVQRTTAAQKIMSVGWNVLYAVKQSLNIHPKTKPSVIVWGADKS